MSTWKRYVVTYDDTGHEIEVAVSDALETVEILYQINSFWSAAEDRLREADDDVLTAVLRMLCRRVLMESASNYSTLDDFVRGDIEGWGPLDGTYGIKLIRIDDLSLDGDVSIVSFPYSPPKESDLS